MIAGLNAKKVLKPSARVLELVSGLVVSLERLEFCDAPAKLSISASSPSLIF